MVLAVLKGSPELKLDDYMERLKSAFTAFIRGSNKERMPNKKAMRFFSNIFNDVAKRYDGQPLQLRDGKLFNALLERYLLLSPALIKYNPGVVLENLGLAAPPRDGTHGYRTDIFIEEEGEVYLKFNLKSKGGLSAKIGENVDALLRSLSAALKTYSFPEDLLVKIWEPLSRSMNFCT